MISTVEIEQLIRAVIPDAQIKAADMTGTGDHFEITVVSGAFQGKTTLEQHKMVFAALAAEMDRRIHAVKIKTQAAI
jgi:stress-induced morphogen